MFQTIHYQAPPKKITVATKNDWTQVSGHAGQTLDWLVFDCQPGVPLPEPVRIELSKEQLPHHFKNTAHTRCMA